MPKFAPVVPVGLAAYLKDQNVFGNYHLLLAHDVVDKPEEYAQVYNEVTTHNFGTIIMDNSVVELGKAVDAKTMAEAVRVTNANVVVLEDSLLDMQGTIDATYAAADAYKHIRAEKLVIPQGSNWQEWGECLEAIGHLGNWIGIPKNLNEKLDVSRACGIAAAVAMFPHAKIHLFGTSDDLQDDLLGALESVTRANWNVKGLDSAMPAWLGLRDNKHLQYTQGEVGRRGDWWDTWSEEVDKRGWDIPKVQTLIDNIQWMDSMLFGRGIPRRNV